MFGTDGIRGIFGEKLTCSLAFKVGRAIGIECVGCEGKGVVVGRDTRPSGVALMHALISGILSQGINVADLGIATTPAVGFMTSKGYNFGVVITASHNTAEYNGIKIFNKCGMKLLSAEESKMENVLKNINRYAYSKNVGRLKNTKPKEYFEFLTSILKEHKFEFRVCFDCANGAGLAIAKKVFKDRFKEVFFINTSTNGDNINKGCGATSVGALRQFVLLKKLDFGFAFDGDADRIIMIDRFGNSIDGDGVLRILTEYFLSENELFSCVVGTVLTNSGLENYLKTQGLKLVRTAVGDKFISEHMFKNKLVLGGEPAGHIIIANLNPTGDGILCAIMLVLAIFKLGKNCKRWFCGYDQIPQYYLNIKYDGDHMVANGECLDVTKIVNKLTRKAGKNCRLVVRKSGTEPLIRIMIEGYNKEKIERTLEAIEKEFDNIKI